MTSKQFGDDNQASTTYFIEVLEVQSILSDLCDDLKWLETIRSRFDRLETILCKYQEQSILLNPYLSQLTEPLVQAIKKPVLAAFALTAETAAIEAFSMVRDQRTMTEAARSNDCFVMIV